MRYVTHIKEECWKLIWLLIWLFTIDILLMTFRGSRWLACYIDLTAVASYFIINYIEYHKRKTFYGQLEAISKQLDKVYLLPEMMEKVTTQEQKQLSEILHSMEKSMSEHVNDYKYKNREYKEYIEIWIHEVKVPIATINLMIANHGSEVAKGLQDEIKKIEDYTEQALFYARSNFVETDYLVTEVALKDVVHQVLVRNKRGLIMKNTTADIHDLEVNVLSDGKWLGFIIGQIVANSLKYAKEKLTLEICACNVGQAIQLHIKDNGIGILSQDIPMVFEKGYVGSNGRQSTKSTGIGLYLCKKLCTKLGHGITIESDGSTGCEVILHFTKSTYYDTVS